MSTGNSDELAYEAATNRSYLKALEQRLTRTPVVVSVTANEKYANNIPRGEVAQFGPLVARVGLDVDDEDLGTAFYIGARYLSQADWEHRVISWDARMAKIFFDPDGCQLELNDRVLVRRTLMVRGQDIVKVFDDWKTPVPAEQSPFKVRKLEVPAAPRRSDRRARPEATPTPPVEAPALRPPVTVPTPRAVPRQSAPPMLPKPPVPVQSPTPPDRPNPNEAVRKRLEHGMRAVEAVKYALNAPRTAALTSVLSTLQPDQYRLVARPPGEPLIIQGHPGTGKTIIAVHRAAYLVSPERKKERAGRLLLLGPTEHYVRHVSEILNDLDVAQHVTLKALPTWLAEIAGFTHPLQIAEGRREDVGKFVKNIVDQAARLLELDEHPPTPTRSERMKLQRLYEIIRAGGTARGRLELGNYSRPWIKTLPPFHVAFGLRGYLPLFAQASLSLGHAPTKYDHVIVDEAQDISGLEWEIIRAHNVHGRWTLLGDTNQRRRSDIGDADWGKVAERLEIKTDSGPVQPEIIERGYRSTQPILDFANRLLPPDARTTQSLQQYGPAPTVILLSKPRKRDARAVQEAIRLRATYEGTVAIITTETEAIEKALLNARWRRSSRPGDWTNNDQQLAVRTPESARGVEFDGVVVVEPSLFVPHTALVGMLYTSLTRANRELAVVHHLPLPPALSRSGATKVE
nr:hypothetical protein GCM10020063_010560 [Dactylosporangium thailandense]